MKRLIHNLMVGGCVLMVAGTGCRKYQGSDLTEQKHPTLMEARELVENQDREAARELLRAFLRKNPDFAHAHLQLAMIYQAQEKPVKAIYHFEEYLSARPDTPKADLLRPLVEDEKRRLAFLYGNGLTEAPETPDADALREENRMLRQERARLRVELQQATLRDSGEARQPPADWAEERLALLKEIENLRSGEPETEGFEVVTPDGPRSYTVQRGDTLSGIAQKMYGRASDWRKIYRANRGQLPTENSLRLGMTLVIPE